MDSIYSGVMLLCGIQLVAFLAELTGLKLLDTNIGNAHLEASTKENFVIIAGPEFKGLKGHILVIQEASTEF